MNVNYSPRSHGKAIQEILQQCIRYPDRKDTLEGVLKWWLPQSSTQLRQEEVQQAFDVLVSMTWVNKRRTNRCEEIYSVNKARLEQIVSFLIKSEHDEKDV